MAWETGEAGDSRIEDVGGNERIYIYDGDARVRGDGHVNARERYFDASAWEDRLRRRASAGTGEVRRSAVYGDGGFGLAGVLCQPDQGFAAESIELLSYSVTHIEGGKDGFLIWHSPY